MVSLLSAFIGAFFGAMFSFLAATLYGHMRDVRRQCDYVICNLNRLNNKVKISDFAEFKAGIHSNMYYLPNNIRKDIADFINTIVGDYYDEAKRSNIIAIMEKTSKNMFCRY